MGRRAMPTSRAAERSFPVRLRVAVPAGGFGDQLNAMQAWLDAHVGHGAFWIGADAGPGKADAALLYFLDVGGAKAFVDRFACGMVLPNAPPEDQSR